MNPFVAPGMALLFMLLSLTVLICIMLPDENVPVLCSAINKLAAKLQDVVSFRTIELPSRALRTLGSAIRVTVVGEAEPMTTTEKSRKWKRDDLKITIPSPSRFLLDEEEDEATAALRREFLPENGGVRLPSPCGTDYEIDESDYELLTPWCGDDDSGCFADDEQDVIEEADEASEGFGCWKRHCKLPLKTVEVRKAIFHTRDPSMEASVMLDIAEAPVVAFRFEDVSKSPITAFRVQDIPKTSVADFGFGDASKTPVTAFRAQDIPKTPLTAFRVEVAKGLSLSSDLVEWTPRSPKHWLAVSPPRREPETDWDSDSDTDAERYSVALREPGWAFVDELDREGIRLWDY